MARRYLFADESGDLEFARKPNVSKFYIIGAISLDPTKCGQELFDLRRQLIWDKQPVREFFHASEDKQVIRDAVFRFLQTIDMSIYATVMEKSKAQPQVRASKERFYQYGWYYLLKYVAPKIVGKDDELLVTAATVGTKKAQASFTSAVNDVLAQTTPLPRNRWATYFCKSATDPCLQVADYCIWAIQRRFESGGTDDRAYRLIRNRIEYEYELWGHGTKHYY